MTPIDQFIHRLQKHLGHCPGPGSVTKSEISAAEKVLGVKLPPSYCKLLMVCDSDDMPHWIYWLGENLPSWAADLIGSKGIGVQPPFLLPICGDGSGDQFCFDTRNEDEMGEYPIVRFDHEMQDENATVFERVAPDLGTFLLQLLPP